MSFGICFKEIKLNNNMHNVIALCLKREKIEANSYIWYLLIRYLELFLRICRDFKLKFLL